MSNRRNFLETIIGYSCCLPLQWTVLKMATHPKHQFEALLESHIQDFKLSLLGDDPGTGYQNVVDRYLTPSKVIQWESTGTDYKYKFMNGDGIKFLFSRSDGVSQTLILV